MIGLEQSASGCHTAIAPSPLTNRIPFRRLSRLLAARPFALPSAVAWALLLGGLFSVGGCQRKATVNVRQVNIEASRPDTSPFDVATDFLNRLDEFEPNKARDQILFNLRQWVREQKDSVDWIADPMYRRIPKRYLDASGSTDLAEPQFQPFDAVVLQEAVWLRDIARSVIARPETPHGRQAWFQNLEATQAMSPDEVVDLRTAERLFDWCIRNLQMEEEDSPADRLTPPGGKESDRLRRVRYVWDCLLHGSGDWLEMSRAFILLCRQQAIPAVMLAVDTDDQDALPRPWLPAVLVGRRLYLFDMRLGLPVVGRAGEGIASLDEILAEPDLLQQMAAPGTPYRLAPAELGNLVALIDAAPAHLSQRMRLVESRLAGNRKMVLTSTPTTLAVKLREVAGINRVDIWMLPYQSYEFQRFMLRAVSGGPRPVEFEQLTTRMESESRPFERMSPLLRGRLLQFRGVFESVDDQLGAKGLLMQARTPDREIALIEQQAMKSNFSASLAREAKRFAISSKQFASYWLGLIAYESQDYEVAVDYFGKRVREAPATTGEPSPWVAGATYNLARAYEAVGFRDHNLDALQRAHSLLQQSTGPLAAGNQVRARQLQATIDSWAND